MTKAGEPGPRRRRELSDEERALLPFRYVGDRGEDPQKRLQAWVHDQEERGKPTYLIVDDPTYWIQLKRA